MTKTLKELAIALAIFAGIPLFIWALIMSSNQDLKDWKQSCVNGGGVVTFMYDHYVCTNHGAVIGNYYQ